MTAQLVTDALLMAIWRRGKPDSLVHHSDQGNQYTSEQFQRPMADHGITGSMSRSGNVWDDVAMACSDSHDVRSPDRSLTDGPFDGRPLCWATL